MNAVYERMGDPIVASRDPKLTKFVYTIEHGNAMLTVLGERGVVSGIRLWALPSATPSTADPFGVKLNADESALLGARGKPSRIASDIDGPFDSYQSGDVLWMYHINATQTVANVTVSTTEQSIEDLPEQHVPAVHRGSSPSDAIVVVQPNADDVKRWERLYLAVHPCTGGGEWQVRTAEKAGVLDRISAACSNGSAVQTFYFSPVIKAAPA